MKFDEQGNRVVARQVNAAETRELAYWFEQEKVDIWGFCDHPIACDDNENVTHLCSRFKGHGGWCAALHRGEVAGRKIRKVEQG